MNPIATVNIALAMLFFICYAYQAFYIAVPFVKKPTPHRPAQQNRFAVLIAARNEAAVIGYLIDSIHAQTYDPERITVFVIADNCTDDTARVAQAAGAVVYKRNNTRRVGKGYALNELLHNIRRDYPDDLFDGFFVFDADNVLDPHYIEEMNRTFSDGYEIVTSYRNSKNYGDNWISAGYGLWFLRESKYLNNARMLLHTSCAVGGTGFLFHRAVMERTGGWNFFLLTEDIEFTINRVVNGEKIGYCSRAVLYDEQPTSFRQSWNQRMRWAKGFLQVFRKYGSSLLRRAAKGSFSAYDMVMTTMPAMLLSICGILINIACLIVGIAGKDRVLIETGGIALLQTLVTTYLGAFAIGLITTITEWQQIHTTTARKIGYLFTFPLFMLTYIPIALCAIFRKVRWTPIAHQRAASVAEICAPQKPAA